MNYINVNYIKLLIIKILIMYFSVYHLYLIMFMYLICKSDTFVVQLQNKFHLWGVAYHDYDLH